MSSPATAAAPIPTHEFADALLAGIHRVVSSQESLNRINVFPVADGDTGTNLALTLLAARSALERHRSDTAGQLLERVADALLDGARGNSGAIMAQFFQGLADSLREKSALTVSALSSALTSGSDYARDALLEPREGTILSVIRVMAEATRDVLGDVSDLESLLSRSLDRCRAALAQTTEQLAELKKAGVVDAGAQGFVNLLEGMLAYTRDRQLPDFDALPVASEFLATDTAGDEVDLDYRFCTECIVTGENIDRRLLREELAALGGSLVLAGTHGKAKIHIHVNEPAELFRTAAKYGVVSGEKADDMHRQQSSTHAKRGAVAIITDSAADLSDDLLEALDVHSVPLRVHFADKGYLDKLSISADQFFTELASNPAHPQTSQPAPGDYRRQFQFLASHYNDVLALSLTASVSGTHTAAVSAAERITGADRLTVIDTLNASVGQGLIVRDAAERANSGEALAEIRKAVINNIERTRSFALLKDLTYAVRGGRVPSWARYIADVLQLNPVLGTTPDGHIKPISALVGRHNRVAKFARFVARRAQSGKRYRVAISHAQSAADAEALAERLNTLLDVTDAIDISETGAAIGVHGGPGTLVAALQERD
ncbi:MAG: DegV family protein [Pseudomonadota bacterium]